MLSITRRQLLTQGATAAGIAGISPFLLKQAFAQAIEAASQTPSPLAALTLNRAAYGWRPGELETFGQLGLVGWVEQQLRAPADETELCARKLKSATLHIEYPAGDLGNGKKHKALKEDRPLKAINASLPELWKLMDYNKVNYYERVRPAHEVRAATWIRAIHSTWQLREVMTEFWHNHFNVNVDANEAIAATFPLHDRLIRRHCLGNFREFLEDVAKSPAMLYYLNNATSKASPANENYARELFELHTLGADNYYNHLYNRWREVPGAAQGQPIGYIDQDVYEAARAFTGWTVADGTDPGRGGVFPSTGEFHYHEGWHDNYQKRVLGTEFDPNSPPMSDGRKVLDLLAFHPGTARHICAKLCRRLVSDQPPASLVERAVAAWTASARKSDQIAQTVRVILLSPEFTATPPQKVKRPFEFIASLVRATGADFSFNDNFHWSFYLTGYKHFNWPTPTGHPDRSDYWLNTNTMLSSWNLVFALFEDWYATAKFAPLEQMPADHAPEAVADYWTQRLLGRVQAQPLRAGLLEFLQGAGWKDLAAAGSQDEMAVRLRELVHLIALSPDFLLR